MPGVIARAGVLQLALVVAIAMIGGRALWHFGLRSGAAPVGAVGS